MSNGPGKGRGAWYYLPVDCRALECVNRLSIEQKVKLVDELPKMFFDEEYTCPQTEDIGLDLILSIIWSTAYRLKDGARKRNEGKPKGTLGESKGEKAIPKDLIQINSREEKIKTSIEKLRQEGYEEERIEKAVEKMTGRDDINSPYAWLKKTIDNDGTRMTDEEAAEILNSLLC